MQAAIGRTIIIYKAQHAYSSHACVTRLPDGDWLVAFAQSLERVPYTCIRPAIPSISTSSPAPATGV